MSKQDLEKLIHAFISSGLHYCNSFSQAFPKKYLGNYSLFRMLLLEV